MSRTARHPGLVTLRHGLLLGAAGLALTPLLAAPPETRIVRSLTSGNDIVVVDRISEEFRPTASPFGLLGPTLLVGVDAGAGNDTVTLTGRFDLDARINPFRTYLELPGPGAILDALLEPPTYSVAAVGVDGGAGFDRVRNLTNADVTARGSFVHSDFRMGSPGFPAALNDASLDSRLNVSATGIAGGADFGYFENARRLTVEAESDITRTRITLSMADLGDVPQNIFGTATAIGIDGGGPTIAFGERIAVEARNSAAATMEVTADSAGVAPDISITGATLASPSHAVRTIADATGIIGSGHRDRLLNDGKMVITALGELTGVDISITPNSFALPNIIMPDIEVESQVASTARGIVGGGGADILGNAGTLELTAETNFLTVGIAIGDAIIDASAIEVLIDPPGLPERPAGGSVADVAGILGDGGRGIAGGDTITNQGSITGTAKSVVETASVFIAAPINSMTGQSETVAGKLLDFLSLALSDGASSSALSFATGIDGMAGNDAITHAGSIAMTAEARADTLSITADVLGFIEGGGEDDGGGGGGPGLGDVSLGLDVYNTATFAYAAASGVEGGEGADVLAAPPGATTSVTATATARNLDINVSFTTEDKSIAVSGAGVFARLWSGADAIGFDGGTGADQIGVAGALLATATALSQSLGISAGVDLVETGANLSASFIDTAIIAESNATGIAAREAADSVTTNALITAIADSDAESIGVDLGVSVATDKGLAGTGSALFSTTLSTAIARGLDRAPLLPLPEQGVAHTTIGGVLPMIASATADLQRIAVGLNVAVSMKGVALGASLLSADSEAVADAIGFAGSAATDRLIASAPLTANATADTVSTITGASVAVAVQGVGLGVSVLDADTQSTALATGADLGLGNDIASFARPVSATATSKTLNNLNTIAISGAKDGVALGAALGRLSTSDIARATTLAAGAGDDVVSASGALTARATSEADLVIVGVELGGVMNGVSAGVTLLESGGLSEARATAVDLGAGNDRFDLGAQPISATTRADASGNSVGVAINGTYQGVGAGVTVMDFSTVATSVAQGIAAGAGDDRAVSRGGTTVTAESFAKDLGVGVSIGGAVYGVGAGGNALMGATLANADAVGIDGGGGADQLGLAGTATIKAVADAERTNVSVAGSFAIGVALAGNFIDATGTATATAVGVRGDGGAEPAGADRIETDSLLTVIADATAKGSSFSFAIPIAPVGIGANVLEGAVDATASATGIDSGGEDDIILTNAVTASADALAKSLTVSFTTLGLNYGDMTNRAFATATGIATGSGADKLVASGLQSATATAETEALGIGIVLNGGNVTAIGSEADARAIAVDGGDGDDTLDAQKGASATATATNPLKLVDVALTGVSAATVMNSSIAETIAMAGGAGSDLLLAGGALSSTSTATMEVDRIGVTIAGATAGELSATGRATAFGILAGEGNDSADVQALTTTANATTDVSAITVNLVGAGITRAGVLPFAEAIGFDGGAGADSLLARGILDVSAQSTGIVDSTTVVLTGMVIGREGALAEARATGATGGDGLDTLRLVRDATVDATASADAGSTNATLIGGSLATVGALATATATGLSGGIDDDLLQADAALTVSSWADSTANLLNVALVGGSLANVQMGSVGSAVGMAGGTGADTLAVNGSADISALATIDSTVLSITGLGITGSTARRAASATSSGLAAGGGADLVLVRGALDSTATTRVTAGVSSWSLAAVGITAARSQLAANAVGIDLGGDNDRVETTGKITVLAEVEGEQSQGFYSLAQVLRADSRTTADAIANGILGGTGADQILLSGELDVRADARSASTSIFGAGAGVNDTSADFITNAEATGVDAGTGDDIIDLQRNAFIRSFAENIAGSIDVTLIGGFGTQLQLIAQNRANGLSGGDGDDQLFNTRTLDVESTALLKSERRSISIIGGGFAETGLFATVTTGGMIGGTGADTLVNRPGATIDLFAIAGLTLTSGDISIAGGTLASGLGRANTGATAMSGGDGNDVLANRGTITATTNARIDSRSSSFNVLGVSGNISDLRAIAGTLGIEGGAGHDEIVQSGTLGIQALAVSDHSSTNFSALGLAAGLSALASESKATGIDAGSGANMVLLETGGTNRAVANAEAIASSSVEVGIGAALGRSAIAANAQATGIAAGAGNDMVIARAPLTAEARPFVSIGSAQTAFLGGNGSESAGLATGIARGVMLGDGDNGLTVGGPIRALFAGQAFGSGAASTTAIGNTNVAARLRIQGVAEGIMAGGGADTIDVVGDVLADLQSTANSTVRVTSGALFSDGIARATADAILAGSGIFDTGGTGSITVSRGVTVAARALPREAAPGVGVTRANAISFGKTDGLDVDAIAQSSAFGVAELAGIRAPESSLSITNGGVITARSDLAIDTRAESYGNSGVFGEARSDTTSRIGGSTLFGIVAAKDLQLANDGTVSATHNPLVSAASFAEATGQGFVDPDAVANTTIFATGLTAVGVALDSGTITNRGTISGVTSPQVDRARALARRQPNEGGRIDAFTTVNVIADNNRAWGVRTETDLPVTIVNTGTISATAAPRIVVLAESFGASSAGDASVIVSASALNTQAIGIETAGGNDVIENHGTVQADTNVSLSITTASTRGNGEAGFRLVTPVASTIAIGIRTGDGNDTVVNSGRIGAQGSLAIDTSSGNDRVTLLSGSDISGEVRLGSGDDLLTLSGKTSLDQIVDGGAGTDQLTAIGDHDLRGSHTGFERILKQGDGVLALGSQPWNSSQWMRIEQGSVEARVPSLTNGNHVLTTVIRPNGTNGQLDLVGGSASIRGKLVVEKGADGPFVNGTTWDVVRAEGGLNIGQLAITLPDPTALVSFGSSLFNARRVRVNVSVRPMAEMARRGEARSLGAALDRATPIATGEVARTITSLQAMDTATEVRGALNAMAPTLLPLSLQAGASALDNALAVAGATTPAGASFVPGLQLAASPVAGATVPGTLSWAAQFDRAPATNGAPARGPVMGFASGMVMGLSDDVRIGLSMMHQMAESRADGGASGGARSQAAIARIDADLDHGIAVSGALAMGSSRFAGSRAVSGTLGTTDARVVADMPMLGADLAASWAAPTAGPVGLGLHSRLAWRHVALPQLAETSSAGLAIAADGGRHQRLEGAVGARFDLAEQRVGPWAISGQLGADIVQRLGGAPERVFARFQDMPDFAFALDSSGAPATRLGLTAGLAARHAPTGTRFSLGATRGDARAAGALTVGASIGLDF